MEDIDAAAADRDDTITEEYSLRPGGVLALGERGIYVERPGEGVVFVDADNVVEVQYDEFDWFIGIISLFLTGFGLYSTTKHVLGGLAFAAAGVVSFYLTYRKRGKLSFSISGRAKPLQLYPEHPQTAYNGLRPLMADDGDE